jgi:hypothetical protein
LSAEVTRDGAYVVVREPHPQFAHQLPGVPDYQRYGAPR